MVLIVCLNPTLQKTILTNRINEGKINRLKKYYLDIAGKGIIVAKALKYLGLPSCCLTHLGGNFKKYFLKRAKEERLRIAYISCNTEIRFCTTLIQQGSKSVTELVEDAFVIDKKIEKIVLLAYQKLLKNKKLVILTGSLVKGYSDSLFAKMAEISRKKGIPLIADTRGNVLLKLIRQKPFIIKINIDEFLETFYPNFKKERRTAQIYKLIENKLKELWEKYNINTILTDGANSILSCLSGEICYHSPVKLKFILNTTGCGDVFCAGIAAYYLKLQNLKKAIDFACKLAAKNAISLRPGFIKKNLY